MIRLEHIFKTYNKGKGGAVAALKDVSLTFPDKGMVFLVGKSGCGKTTLLNILGKLDEPDSGRLIVDDKWEFGREEADNYRNKYVGFVFQDYNLMEDFTVYENIALARSINRETATEKDIDEILEKVGLAGYGPRRVTKISGGERQRVAIARALFKRSDLILADEPTGNLDEKSGVAILDLLKSISKEKLVVVISHDMAAAESYADRMIVMADGRVVDDSSLVFEGEYLTFEGGDVPKFDDAKKDGEKGRVKHVKNSILRKTDVEGWVLPLETANYEKAQKTAGKKSKEKPATKLPTKVLSKLAFSKIRRHKVRFVLSLILMIVSLAVVGTSIVFSGYDYGKAAAAALQEFDEVGAIIQKGQSLNAFGYVDRWPRLLDYEDATAVKELTGMSGLDKMFQLPLGVLDFSPVDNGFLNMYTDVELVFETTKANLGNFGYKLKHGNIPTSAERDENGFLHVAITDYAAFVMSTFGARLADGSGMRGFGEEELLEKCVSFGSEAYFIEGIIETDYKDYLDVAYMQTSRDEYEESNPELYVRMRYFDYIADYYYTSIYIAPGAGNNLFSGQYNEGDRAIMSVSRFKEHFNRQLADAETVDDKPEIAWAKGYSNLAQFSAAENVALVTENEFYAIFGYEFVKNTTLPVDYNINNTRQGIGAAYFSRDIKIVGVVKNISMEQIGKGSALIVSDEVFNAFANDGSVWCGMHFKLPGTEAEQAALINVLDKEAYYLRTFTSYTSGEAFNTICLFREVFKIFAIILSLACALFIADFMITAIKDRQNEIGILRAMGVRGADISIMFLIQAVVIFVLGAIFASLAMTGLNEIMRSVTYSSLFANEGPMIAFVPLITVTAVPYVSMLGIMLLVLAVSTALPIAKLNSMRPIDCIKKA